MNARLLGALAVAVLLSACAGTREPTVPMRTLAEPGPCAVRPATLVVMLPGLHSLPEEFVREGFVRAVRERQIAADLLLVDAHRGYYDQRSVVIRLQDDVIEPARRQGYRQVWLVGISLGGLGAMLYAAGHPGDVDGIVMLAPYLGTRASAQQVRDAGGLAAWSAPNEPAGGDADVFVWRWLQQQTAATGAAKRMPIHLAYGVDDRFAFNAGVLREVLPADRVYTTNGGHEWAPWWRLWGQVLDAGVFPRDTTCVRG